MTERNSDTEKTEKEGHICGGNPLTGTPVRKIAGYLSDEQVASLWDGMDRRGILSAFADDDLMATFDAYLSHDMNISATARVLYMHRNTLMYRLKKLRRITGVDVSSFDGAVTLSLLRLFMDEKRN